MNWATQAFHVARKDVRYTRVALVLYSVLAVVALAHALMLPAVSPGGVVKPSPLSVAMFLLMLLGIILAATVVQADSPIQSNAFWASRPFHPTGMLSAKLLYCAAVILAIPLLAQLIGVMQYDAAPGVIIATLAASTAVYGLLLLSTIVVASLTTDLRGFIVAALALLVGFVLLAMTVPASIGLLFSKASFASYAAIAIVASVFLLVWLYRRRDVSRIAWLGAAVAVGAASMTAGSDERPTKAIPVPAARRAATITLDRVGSLAASRNRADLGNPVELPVHFVVSNVPANTQLGLQIDSASVRLSDGSRVRSRPHYGVLPLERGRGALPPNVRQYGDAGDSLGSPGINLLFDVDAARLTDAAMDDLELWGTVLVSDVVPLMSSRVGAGERTASVGGFRVEVVDGPAMSLPVGPAPKNAVFEPNTRTISVSVASILDPRGRAERRDIGLALINEARNEGVVVTAQGYTISDWVVLPGARIMTSLIQFNGRSSQAQDGQQITQTFPVVGPVSETPLPRRQGLFPGNSWYKDAKIIVVKWIPQGSYPLHLRTSLD